MTRDNFGNRRAAPVRMETTLRQLRRSMDNWNVEMLETTPDRDNRTGVTVRYYKVGAWQQVYCNSYASRSENLRQIFLFVDRLRVAEKHGVSYTGLTSTRDLATAGPESQKTTKLQDAYLTLGVLPSDPTDLIKKVYQGKATFYHPDHAGGDQEKFIQLQQAYEAIMESRGEKP